MLIEKKTRLSTLLAQEDAFWKQRAKVYWLRDGDTNSRFFHAMASARKRRNHILKLVRDDETEATDQHDLCNIAKDYFTSMFEGGVGNYDPIISHVQP